MLAGGQEQQALLGDLIGILLLVLAMRVLSLEMYPSGHIICALFYIYKSIFTDSKKKTISNKKCVLCTSEAALLSLYHSYPRDDSSAFPGGRNFSSEVSQKVVYYFFK